MILRDATPADAAAIARVHVRSWRDGYRGIVAADVLAAQSEASRDQRWRAILGDPGDGFTVVAESGGVVIGFCSGVTATGEIAALYVDPDHWGRGAGTALLVAVSTRLGTDVALWVLERNERARRFYAAHGFVADGARSVHEPSGEDEIRLVRSAGVVPARERHR